MPVQRGEIYYVYLDPVFGREMGGYKTRPVAVLSIHDINSKPLVVAVVPGTTAAGKPSHFRNIVSYPPMALTASP
jgi:mRNA-degrading endonuclease toxin of MazEF toxin-antitoxin module